MVTTLCGVVWCNPNCAKPSMNCFHIYSLFHPETRQWVIPAQSSHWSLFYPLKHDELMKVYVESYSLHAALQYSAFACMGKLDHKKPVSFQINLCSDIQGTAFHWGDSPLILYLTFFSHFGTVCDLSFSVFPLASFVANVLASLTSLSPVCSKHIYVLFSFPHLSPPTFILLSYTTAPPPKRNIEPLLSWKPSSLRGWGDTLWPTLRTAALIEIWQIQLTHCALQLVVTRGVACSYHVFWTNRMSLL